jgi:hypothetical protein
MFDIPIYKVEVNHFPKHIPDPLISIINLYLSPYDFDQLETHKYALEILCSDPMIKVGLRRILRNLAESNNEVAISKARKWRRCRRRDDMDPKVPVRCIILKQTYDGNMPRLRKLPWHYEEKGCKGVVATSEIEDNPGIMFLTELTTVRRTRTRFYVRIPSERERKERLAVQKPTLYAREMILYRFGPRHSEFHSVHDDVGNSIFDSKIHVPCHSIEVLGPRRDLTVFLSFEQARKICDFVYSSRPLIRRDTAIMLYRNQFPIYKRWRQAGFIKDDRRSKSQRT